MMTKPHSMWKNKLILGTVFLEFTEELYNTLLDNLQNYKIYMPSWEIFFMIKYLHKYITLKTIKIVGSISLNILADLKNGEAFEAF